MLFDNQTQAGKKTGQLHLYIAWTYKIQKHSNHIRNDPKYQGLV
jgi:hypothetical protein